MSKSRKTEYLKEVVFSKFVSMDTAPAKVRRQRAINKWLASERNNEATNVRLMTVSGDYNILPRVRYDTFLLTVQRIIRDVLGEVVPADALNGAFSGGATTSRKRTEAHPARKYVGKAHVTPDALHMAINQVVGSPAWSSALDEIELVEGNVLFTVPKNTEIDRCCCKEPDLNMYLQKGVGNYIRRRLRFAGIDLNDQTRNQSLARIGSRDGSLATLDLSAASDSICTQLVFWCLPTLWYETLTALRSPVTIIDGELHVNEMFSSMGNGFTFELESLLFYAIARATAYHLGVSGVISVYGDDLIVPTGIAGYLISVLSFLGFETNVDKSFMDGSFRESCGGHYDGGLDITPFYVRKPPSSLIDVIHLANQIRKWAAFDGLRILDPEVEDLWILLSSVVPKRLWGGHDHNDKTRLVSVWQPPRPMRLSTIKKRRSLGVGGYVLWLNTTQDRQSLGECISTSYEDPDWNGVFRLRPVRSVGAVTDTWFLHEVVRPI